MTRAARPAARAAHPPRRRLRGQPRHVRAVSSPSRASAWTRPPTARRRSRRRAELLPDLMVMDLSLPDPRRMGGDAAAQGRRAHASDPRPRPHRTRARRSLARGRPGAGCDGYVTKPCLPEDLVARDPAACSRRPRRRSARRARGDSVPRTTKAKGRAGARAAQPSRAAAKAPARRAAGAEGRRAPARRAAPPAAEPAARPPDSRGKYVYCIIRAAKPLSFGSIGIGHRALRGADDQPQRTSPPSSPTRPSRCSTRRGRTSSPTSA